MRKIIYNPSFFYNPNANDGYMHAYHVIGGRWLEAEPYIMKDPYYAYRYAYMAIKDRWEEAEPYIKGSKYQERYERYFKCKL